MKLILRLKIDERQAVQSEAHDLSYLLQRNNTTFVRLYIYSKV
jgi:hypothetical protein